MITYCYSKCSTTEEEVKEGSQQFQGYQSINVADIKWLDWIEKHNRGGIIHYSLPKDGTVKEGCIILIEDLRHEKKEFAN